MKWWRKPRWRSAWMSSLAGASLIIPSGMPSGRMRVWFRQALRIRMRGHRLVRRITDFFQITINAARFARHAYAAPVPDQLMREGDPFFLWKYFHQLLL